MDWDNSISTIHKKTPSDFISPDTIIQKNLFATLAREEVDKPRRAFDQINQNRPFRINSTDWIHSGIENMDRSMKRTPQIPELNLNMEHYTRALVNVSLANPNSESFTQADRKSVV